MGKVLKALMGFKAEEVEVLYKACLNYMKVCDLCGEIDSEQCSEILSDLIDAFECALCDFRNEAEIRPSDC